MNNVFSIGPLRTRFRERLKNSPRLLPDMSWLLATNVVTVLSGMIIFKIVSRWISASDYGQAALVLGMVGLLNQVISSPAILAHLRLYFEHAKVGQGEAYSRTVLRLLLRTSAIMSAIYLLIAVSYKVAADNVYWSLAFPAMLLLFAQTQLLGTIAFLEGQKRYRAITFALSLSKALQVPFLLALVWMAVGGPAAVLSSQFLAAIAVVLVWSARSYSRRLPAVSDDRSFTIAEIAESASKSFGWSLYLFSLFSWFLSTSDRYVVEHFWTSKDVGIYALNYGLWSVPYLSLNSWLEAVVRARIFERAEANDMTGLKRLFRERTALAIALGAALTAVIYFAGHWIALRIIGERYWFDERLMMLVCVAHFFYVIAASYHPVFQALKKTNALMLIVLVTSGFNIGLNLAIVPRLGIVGAAWSTFAAYALMCIITVIVGWIVISREVAHSSLHELGQPF